MTVGSQSPGHSAHFTNVIDLPHLAGHGPQCEDGVTVSITILVGVARILTLQTRVRHPRTRQTTVTPGEALSAATTIVPN